jgi:hypothetical protein
VLQLDEEGEAHTEPAYPGVLVKPVPLLPSSSEGDLTFGKLNAVSVRVSPCERLPTLVDQPRLASE